MSRQSGHEIEPETIAAAIDRASRAFGAPEDGGDRLCEPRSPRQPSGDAAIAAGLIEGWFAGRASGAGEGTDRDGTAEASILSAFAGAGGCFLARATSFPEGHPIARAIRRGVDGLRVAFEEGLARAGVDDPSRLASRLASLWLGAATTGAWDDHREAAKALLDAAGLGPRARREKALRCSEARYRAIFEDSPIRTMILSPDGRLVQVNRAWERFHGPIAEFPRDWDLLGDPQLIEHGLQSQLGRGLAGEAMDLPAVPYLNRDAEPDEHPRWVQGSIFPIRDGAGTVRELVINFGDVTEAKQDAQVARGQAEVLARTLDTLASGPDLDRFLGTVLEAMADQLRADTASLWFASGDDDGVRLLMEYDAGALRPASESRHPDATRVAWSPTPEQQAFLDARRHDGVMVYEDIEVDPVDEPYRSYLIAQGIRSILLIYLFLGDELVGIFSVRSKTKRRYPPEEIALAQALGRQATLAIQLTRLARQARETAVLEERNRLAREIHDTLAQGLVAILVQLEAGEDARTNQPCEAWRHVERAREMARMGLDEARRSVRALRPGVLEGHDLASALTRLADEAAEGIPIRVRFRLVGPSRPLPPAIEDELFRIAREALTNALRHAKADQIWIELGFCPPGVRLVIEDDGQGGAMASSGQGGGFGLIGMRERAEQLGAEFSIQDACAGPARRGTRIVVEVPDRDSGREGRSDD